MSEEIDVTISAFQNFMKHNSLSLIHFNAFEIEYGSAEDIAFQILSCTISMEKNQVFGKNLVFKYTIIFLNIYITLTIAWQVLRGNLIFAAQ